MPLQIEKVVTHTLVHPTDDMVSVRFTIEAERVKVEWFRKHAIQCRIFRTLDDARRIYRDCRDQRGYLPW